MIPVVMMEPEFVDNRHMDKPVDREKTCPLLLRVFCSTGRHNSMGDYQRGNTPTNELQIYTWLDATLKELTGLVKEVNVDARAKGTFFDFALVVPEMRSPTYRINEIGSTCSGRKGAEDSFTLASCGFCIGDYLDIAITPPHSASALLSGGMLPQPRMGRGRPY